jgi:hypothetical protein
MVRCWFPHKLIFFHVEELLKLKGNEIWILALIETRLFRTLVLLHGIGRTDLEWLTSFSAMGAEVR